MQRACRENGKVYANYEAVDGRNYGLKRANLCVQLSDEIVQIVPDSILQSTRSAQRTS